MSKNINRTIIILAIAIIMIPPVLVTKRYFELIHHAQISTANHIAGSLANYLDSVGYLGASDSTISGFSTFIKPHTILSYTPPDSTNAITFLVPDNVVINIAGSMGTGGTVSCTYKGKSSKAWGF